MTKRNILIAICVLLISAVFAQESKNAQENVKTKMEAFTSRTGSITKFIDTKLPSLKASYVTAQTRIRKVVIVNTSTFFYQIEKPGEYGSLTASIEYSDLLEILKALKSLRSDEEKDASSNPDYLENYFTTVDGFQIGYYVDKGKSKWYIRLTRYGNENTLFLDNADSIESPFMDAKNKIEQLRL